MKKFLAGIVAVVCSFQMTAFADVLDEAVEILSTQNTSSTLNFEMSYELNKPMDFLGEMQKYYEDEDYPDMNPVDYQMVAESILDSTANMTMKMNSSEDFKKIDLEMKGDFSLPVKANENLKITGDMSFGLWMAVDFTKSEDFRYEMTMKVPFSRKYFHMDLAKMMGDTKLLTDSPVYSEEYIEELTSKSKELLKEGLKESAEIDKQGSKYRIMFDNDGIISFTEKYFGGIVEMIKEMQEEYKEAGFENISDAELEIPEELVETFKKIKFLGDEGIVIEIDTALGKISDMNILCDFDINIYDILTSFEAEIPEFITKDNSYISFVAKYDYNYMDMGSTTVSFPQINEDNCIYLNEQMEENIADGPDDGYEYENNIEYFYGGVYGLAVKGTFTQPYLAVRGVMEDYSRELSNYEYDSDGVEILWDNGIVTINDTKELLPFDSIILNSLTDEAFWDGVKLELPWNEQKHIIVRDGTTYISPELAKALIGIKIEDCSLTFDDNGMVIDVWAYYEYLNPYYTPVTSEV